MVNKQQTHAVINSQAYIGLENTKYAEHKSITKHT